MHSLSADAPILDEVGGYDPALPVAQDCELRMRAGRRVTRLADLPEPLTVARPMPPAGVAR